MSDVPQYVERCLTHHHACDCREWHFKELEAENKRLHRQNEVLMNRKQDAERELRELDEEARPLVEALRAEVAELEERIEVLEPGSTKWLRTAQQLERENEALIAQDWEAENKRLREAAQAVVDNANPQKVDRDAGLVYVGIQVIDALAAALGEGE